MTLSKLVRIGNSKGVRIPKALLAAAGVDGPVKIYQKGRTIVIAPVRTSRPVREGWEEAAAACAGDPPLDPYVQSEFDLTEWEW